MLSLLITILTNHFLTTNGQLNFVPDNSNSGMIFTKLTDAHITHESCSIFYFYDMKELYEMGDQIESGLDNLSKECDNAMDNTCKLEWNLLKEQYEYTELNLEKIHPKNRQRRSLCKWCGKLQHVLYGTVDEDEAKEMIEVINNSSSAIIENRRMINETAHIVRIMLEEDEKKVHRIQERLNTLYSNSQSAINDKFKRRGIISISRSLINEYETLVESIDQAFTADRGQTPRIIGTDEFRSHIRAVAKSFKSGKRFPIDVFEDNILDIFNFAMIRTR